MKRIIQMSEVLGGVELPEGPCEVCASADAGYDEAAGRMDVRLTTFLRRTALSIKQQPFRADWLPADESVTQFVSREECHEAARQVFHRWVRQIRQAAPGLRPA